MLLKFRNWGVGGCFLILSNFFTQVNCCEEVISAPYLLATGDIGKKRLDSMEECYGHFSQSLLESLPPLPKNAQVLSIGCGTGTRECQMALYWPHAYITAVDNSEDQLMVARKRAADLRLTNIDFVLGDANSLSYTNRYHLVYSRFLLVHVPDAVSVVKRMAHAAVPGGLVVCEELSSSASFYEPDNEFHKKALALIQEVVKKMGVDHDTGKKLYPLMTNAGLTSVKINQLQPDRSNPNTKMQFYYCLAEAKPKLVSVGFKEEELDSLLSGMLAFAKQESSRISMSDLFQAIGYKGNTSKIHSRL